jgi:hypothetical protein
LDQNGDPLVARRYTLAWRAFGPERVDEVVEPTDSAGMQIDLFHKFGATPSPTPWLIRDDDGLYRFPDGMFRGPLTNSSERTGRDPTDAEAPMMAWFERE